MGKKQKFVEEVFYIPTDEERVVHDPYISASANATAYFQTFRSLCNLRIKYAKFMSEGFEQMEFHKTFDKEWTQKNIAFWAKVRDYWKNKLQESYQKEKDYKV